MLAMSTRLHLMDHEKIGVFLDADGVLWPDEGAGGILSGFDSATKTLLVLRKNLPLSMNYSLYVVTNQTLAARGRYPRKAFEVYINQFFQSLIESGLLTGFSVCFHHPNAKIPELKLQRCLCRKPDPGMIFQILHEQRLDPKNCLIIGDRITDIIAGHRAALSSKILIANSRTLEINDLGTHSILWPSILDFHLASDVHDACKVIEKWWENR